MDAAHLGIFPATTGNTVNLTNYGAAWTAGTPGAPVFTLAGGTGAAITAQTVVDANHAKLTLDAGTALGLLTITDPLNAVTAKVQVKNRVRWIPPRRR